MDDSEYKKAIDFLYSFVDYERGSKWKYNDAYFDLRFSGIAIERTTLDTTTTYIGIQLKGICRGFNFDIQRIEGFGTALFLGDTAANSSNAYHYIRLGYIVKCNRGVVCWAGPSLGWCNDNVFIGGEFQSTGEDGTLSVGILLGGSAGCTTYPDTNVFMYPSFEKACSTNASSGRAIYIQDGDANKFINVRLEQGAAEKIEPTVIHASSHDQSRSTAGSPAE